MATRPKKLQETLSKLHYQNPEKCAREIITVTSNYKGLQYFVDTFVFNDGTQKELLKLEGTIPVLYKVFSNGAQKKLCKLDGTIPATYKGTTYNFPISVWLMETHPSNPPTCFVKPTHDMQIRVSSSVDHSGKIYSPYLHKWDSGSSDLLTLIQVLISKFTLEPPVFSRPNSTSSVSTPYPLQPHMPVPVGAPGSGTTTPYPPATSTYPQNQLPYPAYPYPHQQQPHYPLYPSTPYPSSYPQQNYNVPTPYPAYPNSQMPPTTSAAPTNTTNSGTITEEHIRASLLSALEDKMRRLLNEQSAHSQDEQNVLQQLHEELTRGKRTLDIILERLAQEQEELDKNLIMLKDKEAELMKSVERLSEQEPLDVDEAVTPTKPLYKQILNAYAEEAALEDTIYYMGEALRRGVIDLDVFLKQVRSLSHKQFMQRALIQKCRLKAGLAG